MPWAAYGRNIAAQGGSNVGDWNNIWEGRCRNGHPVPNKISTQIPGARHNPSSPSHVDTEGSPNARRASGKRNVGSPNSPRSNHSHSVVGPRNHCASRTCVHRNRHAKCRRSLTLSSRSRTNATDS